MKPEEEEGEGGEAEEKLSAREITERAFDSLAGDDEGGAAAASPVAEAQEETAEQKAERARDDGGRFAKEEKAKPARTATAPTRRTAAEVAATPAPSVKVPSSWKPAARELFASLPPAVQEEVLRVNRETQKVLAENAQLKAQKNPYAEAIAPHEQFIRARGQEPARFVQTLLQTEHALSTGHPQAKAGLLADLVTQYGVTPQDLDAALVARMQGRPMQPQQGQQAQPLQDPRVDKILQALQSQQQAGEQRSMEEAFTRRDEFAGKHEFFADVADSMADMLDVWAKQGKRDVSDEDMERAYTLACQLHPDVAPVWEQRQTAERAAKARASTRSARAAASGLRGSSVVAPPGRDGKLTARQITEKVVEDLEGRV